jgi:lysophospholipase L1-like esterase
MSLMNCRVEKHIPVLIVVLVACQANVFLHAAGAASSDTRWVSTWTTAMQPTDSTFNHQTIRMVVRTTLGGNQARIRLSNLYGTEALSIGSAHLGLRQKDAVVDPHTDRTLSFSGRSSTVIPPGAYVISDPVRLDVPELGDLAISIYLPQSTRLTTGQGVGLQTTYISPVGDYSGQPDMPVSATVLSYYWLAEIYVARTTPASVIVALGDSITNGFGSTPNANKSWPSVLGELLLAKFKDSRVSVVNEGVGGNRITLPSHDVHGSNALARFDRDAMDHPGLSGVIFLEGINDIGSPPSADGKYVSSEDLIAGAQQIVERCHLRGIKIIGGTLTPYAGAPYFSIAGEATRKAFNQWIRNSGSFDAVIDFDRALQDPEQTDRFLPAYDSGDHLHPSNAGYQAMAAEAALVLAHASIIGVKPTK